MRLPAIILSIALAAPAWCAEEKPMTDDQKISHAIGRQVGQTLKSQGITLDMPSFTRSLQESLEGKPDRLTPEENQAALQLVNTRVKERQAAQVIQNKKDGEAFLKANKKKKGVRQTKTGLQIRIDAPGTGASPKETDRVKVHYRGTLTDGTEFDSSHKRGQPAEFPLNGVIAGWTEGLQLLKTGGKAVLTVPADLAYGENGRPGIPPNSVLIFEVELLEILK